MRIDDTNINHYGNLIKRENAHHQVSSTRKKLTETASEVLKFRGVTKRKIAAAALIYTNDIFQTYVNVPDENGH
jgi:hypothetical protein